MLKIQYTVFPFLLSGAYRHIIQHVLLHRHAITRHVATGIDLFTKYRIVVPFFH